MITELNQRTALQFRFAAGATLPATPPNDGALFCVSSIYGTSWPVPVRFVKDVPSYIERAEGVYVLITDGTPNLSFRSAQWGIILEVCASSCVVLSSGNLLTSAELYVGRQGKWVKIV